jgi:hypothetical protein
MNLLRGFTTHIIFRQMTQEESIGLSATISQPIHGNRWYHQCPLSASWCSAEPPSGFEPGQLLPDPHRDTRVPKRRQLGAKQVGYQMMEST